MAILTDETIRRKFYALFARMDRPRQTGVIEGLLTVRDAQAAGELEQLPLDEAVVE